MTTYTTPASNRELSTRGPRKTTPVTTMTAFLLIVLAFTETVVVAQGNDKAAAEALFREARRLVTHHDYTAACPKFEESNRLDPGVGTLANLARCYEKTKRLASAWAIYLEAEALAKKRGELKRARQAAHQAKRLEPKLQRLTIIVDKDNSVRGLVVYRNGLTVGRASWGSLVPVDQGDIEIRAEAPGYTTWKTLVVIGKSSERDHVVKIPALEVLPSDKGPDQHNDSSIGRLPDTQPSKNFRPMPWYRDIGGWALLGSGVAIAAGAGLSIRHADRLKSRGFAETGDLDERDRLIRSSDRWRTGGTVALGVGGAVIITGLIKLAIHRSFETKAQANATRPLFDSAVVLLSYRSISLNMRF